MNLNLVTWGIGLILLGIIMLLFTVGLLPWAAWWLLARYWPVLLIIGGVELLLRRRLTIGLLVVGAFLIVLVGGLLGASGAISLPSRGLLPGPGRVQSGRVQVVPREGDVSAYDLVPGRRSAPGRLPGERFQSIPAGFFAREDISPA